MYQNQKYYSICVCQKICAGFVPTIFSGSVTNINFEHRSSIIVTVVAQGGSLHVSPEITIIKKLKLNFVALVRERTIPIERPPHVGEVSANFCGYRVSCCQRNGSLQPYFRYSRPEPLPFLPSSSSIVLTRLDVPCSRPTTSQKIC
jgi:hypothetical protein